MSELLDDDDIVMISLAENLAKLTPHIGGATKAKFLLKPLEQLCAVEDATVRKTSIKSIQTVLQEANLKDLEAEIVGMIKRLFEQEWITGKISSL